MDIYYKLRITLYCCEAIAAIAGFLGWKKIRNSYWRWFPFYLLVIAATEIITEVDFNIRGDFSFNINIHDFFAVPLQFFFFFWLFHMNMKETKISKWPLAVAAIYLLCLMADLIYFRNEKLWFFSFSYTAGNCLLLVLIIKYFIRLVSGELILRFASQTMFWVATGLLIFYLGSFPFYGMYNTIALKHTDLFNTYWKFATVLDCIMYLLFAFALLWKKTK